MNTNLWLELKKKYSKYYFRIQYSRLFSTCNAFNFYITGGKVAICMTAVWVIAANLDQRKASLNLVNAHKS